MDTASRITSCSSLLHSLPMTICRLVIGVETSASSVLFLISALIGVTGIRILVRAGRALLDESAPAEELDRIEEVISRTRTPEMVGYPKLRARVAGRRRYVELHVQYRSGTSLDQAHQLAHDLRDAIEAELGDAEALIHVEPESSVKEPAETGGPFRSG